MPVFESSTLKNVESANLSSIAEGEPVTGITIQIIRTALTSRSPREACVLRHRRKKMPPG